MRRGRNHPSGLALSGLSAIRTEARRGFDDGILMEVARHPFPVHSLIGPLSAAGDFFH